MATLKAIKRNLLSTSSADLVNFLRTRYSYTEIERLTGLSRSQISKLSSGKSCREDAWRALARVVSGES